MNKNVYPRVVQSAQSLDGTIHIAIDPVSATALYAALEIRCTQLAKSGGHIQYATGYTTLELIRSKLQETLATPVLGGAS